MSLRNSLETLASVFWAHLREYPLPEPCRVALVPREPEVQIQVASGDTVRHLAELLLWAYTLKQVTATWWHTDGGSLQISIHGRSFGGARFLVYGGVPFGACAGLVPLPVGASEGVSVDELYALRDLLGERKAAEVAA